MAQNKYLKQNGEVIYPYTLTDNVLDSQTGNSLTTTLQDLAQFDWCNGIIWCFATRGSTSTTNWTLNKNFGSNGIKINAITMNGNVQDVTFTEALPHGLYGVWVSGETNGTGSELFGVYNRYTTTFRIDCVNYNNAATQPVQLSILVIY